MYEVKAGTLMTLMEWIAHAHTCDTKARQGEFVVSSSSSILLAQFFASFFYFWLPSRIFVTLVKNCVSLFITIGCKIGMTAAATAAAAATDALFLV